MLTNSDDSKYSIMCIPKIVRKELESSLSINSMDKVKQFCVISNCSSENSSGPKVGSVYHCRDTVVKMRLITLTEERWVTESSEKRTGIAQNQCIGPITMPIKTNPPLTGGKTVELSNLYHTRSRAVDFSNMHNNWGEKSVSRDQPDKIDTVASH